jgi:heterodisulfide reductase subunit A-like polyferredoxin
MKIKVVLCNCNGIKFMPEGLDMNTLPFELENDLDVEYAVVHPQLCGRGGLNMLHELLVNAAPDDYFVVAGCGDNQVQFLGHVVDQAKFPDERFVSVNIRCSDNVQARQAILEAVGDVMARNNRAATVSDGFGG